MTNYLRALQSRKPMTEIPEGMTRERAAAAIEDIGRQLRGPLSDAERVMLVHDRDDFRDMLRLLAERDVAP